MSFERFEVFLDKKAEKALDKLDSETRERIMEAIRMLKDGFSPHLDIKKLKGYSNYYRIRVGDYRVIFTLRSDNIIIVLVIRLRKTAYKREL